MQTRHQFLIADARKMDQIEDQSIDLVVTSPPYPMIAMWDELFGKLNSQISLALDTGNAELAFNLMHRELTQVWQECHRVLKQGGYACINIGDATRSMNHCFQLHPNHAQVLSDCRRIGFQALPAILWRKPTNAPTKFMGSGMLPAGAYVSLEHEYILVLRKGPPRVPERGSDSQTGVVRRQHSAYFWEERNLWFSDIWTDIKGKPQSRDALPGRRSGAFPLEVPYRLVQMYSLQCDTVLDPFAGTGTTLAAAMVCARNSIGLELEPGLHQQFMAQAPTWLEMGKKRMHQRLADHRGFIDESEKKGKALAYRNQHYGFPVMTRQEMRLRIPIMNSIRCESPDGSSHENQFNDPDDPEQNSLEVAKNRRPYADKKSQQDDQGSSKHSGNDHDQALWVDYDLPAILEAVTEN